MAMHSTSLRPRVPRIPAHALPLALLASMFAAAVFGLVRGENQLAHRQPVELRTVQGSFQPANDGQSAYQRSGEKLQPVGPRAAIDPR